LYQLIKSPTHVHDGTLDLVIAQCPSIINNVSVGLRDEVCNTDHFPLHMNLNTKPTIENRKVVIKRRYLNRMNNEHFVEQMQTKGIEHNILSCTNPNTATNLMTSAVSSVLDKISPIQTKLSTTGQIKSGIQRS